MRILNYNLVSQDATVLTASNIDPIFPVSNLKNPIRSKRVRTTEGTTTLTIVFDMVTTEPVNSAVLLWPKEDGIRLTDDATITVQANATNVWGSPSVSETLTINNDYSVATHFFSSAQNYRYWRIVITDVTNPYDYIELGKVWLGTSLSVENAQNGFVWKDIDLSRSQENEYGHSYTDEYPVISTLEISYQFLAYADIQIIQNAWRINGARLPVIVVLDPDDDVFDNEHFLIYGKFANQFSLGHVHYNLLNINTITIKELT